MLVLLETLAGIAALVALVPLATYCATGSARQAWHALRGYCAAMGLVLAVAAVFFILVGLALIFAAL